jgi:integrase/recombinase XerD
MVDDIRLFLNYLAKEKKCSKNTLDAYHNDLSQLAEYIASKTNTEAPGNNAEGLNEEHLNMYTASLKEKNYSLSTIARKIAAARTFLKFMANRGKVSDDLAPRLSAPKVRKPLPQSLSVAEIHRVLDETARLPSIDGRRDRAMLELLYATGMQASELMSLNVSDFDSLQKNITINGQKGKPRVIALDKRITDIIKEYIDSYRIKLLADDKEQALFLNQRGERLTRQGFWQIVQSYADLVGLSAKVTPRTIRHSYAVHRLNNGADIQSIQEVLGHAHISTTKAYRQVE